MPGKGPHQLSEGEGSELIPRATSQLGLPQPLPAETVSEGISTGKRGQPAPGESFLGARKGKISDASVKIKLAPYRSDLPIRVKALSGKFSEQSQCWYFDPRDEERVRALAIEIYGTVSFQLLPPT